jgi:single-strand DNA-binding protein
LIGNLGNDAEIRYTPNGHAIAGFSLATTTSWKNADGEKQERTDWHRCQLWGKRAEALAEYLKKGKQIYVQGRVEYSTYEKDGVKMHSTQIRVEDVQLLGGNPSGGGARQARPSRPVAAAPDHSAPVDDDIPF